MPIEPPPSAWVLRPPPDDAPDDLVAIGADLAPGTLLDAYRVGLFPMPAGRPGRRRAPVAWWSPRRRGVLPLDGLRVTRSLRQATRRLDVTIDTAFADVVRACADPGREGAWISAAVAEAYTELHRMGWAHSVEARTADGRLVGGLYGVAIGGLFAGESMFHVPDAEGRDASKVALLALVQMLAADGDPRRLLDVQWQTPHLQSLGVVEVDRAEYRRRLGLALTAPLPSRWAG